MAKNKLWIIIAAIVFAAVIGGIVFVILRIPPVNEQLPPNSAPMAITIVKPTNQTTWPVNVAVPVSALAISQQKIVSIEFWADGILQETQQPEADTNALGRWLWLPVTEGEHSLVVRAIDSDNQVATSNIVRILATAPVGFRILHTAQEGDTWDSLAQICNATPEEVAAQNPDLDPNAPIPVDAQVFIPCDPLLATEGGGGVPASQPPSGQVQPAIEQEPNQYVFAAEQTFRPGVEPPPAPALTAVAEGCSVNLYIEDKSENETGFFVYSAAENAATFQRITTLSANSAPTTLQFVHPQQEGHMQYYVSAFNTAGEAQSNIAAVDVADSQCRASQNELVKYENGRLIVPDNVQLAYFYASVDNGPWERAPLGHGFISPSAGEINLHDTLVQLFGAGGAAGVDLKVWGWRGRDIVDLGPLHIDFSMVSLSICNWEGECGGDVGSTHWTTSAEIASDVPNQTRLLSWDASSPEVTHVIWQVTTRPFTENYSPYPAGLMAAGIGPIESSGEGPAFGKFSLNFADLHTPGFAQMQLDAFDPSIILGPQRAATPANKIWMTDLMQELNTSAVGAHYVQGIYPLTLYVRVTPMASDHPATDPSNVVTVTYGSSTQAAPVLNPAFNVEIVEGSYTPEIPVDYSAWGCVWIVNVDHDTYAKAIMGEAIDYAFGNVPNGMSPDEDQFNSDINYYIETYYQEMASHIGQKACPAKYGGAEEHWYDPLIELLQSTWNGIVEVFNAVKTAIVDVVAAVLPGCGDNADCKAVLMTCLETAITYYTGIPPDLPTYDEMVDKGLDYVVELAVSEAQSQIPYCDQICHDLMKDELKALANSVIWPGQQPACKAAELAHISGYEPMCFPAGVQTQAVEGSVYQPATVQVKVTRLGSAGANPGNAYLKVLILGINEAYGDGHVSTEQAYISMGNDCPEYKQGYCPGSFYYQMTYSEPLIGIPYEPTSMPVPALQPGQSITIPVIIYEAIADVIYPPRMAGMQSALQELGYNAKYLEQSGNRPPDRRHLFDSGSHLLITTGLYCETGGTTVGCGEDNWDYVVP